MAGGATIPPQELLNRMAQTQLYNFCKKRSLDLVHLVVDMREHGDVDDRLILYHGSKSGIVGDIGPMSLRNAISAEGSIWEPIYFSR